MRSVRGVDRRILECGGIVLDIGSADRWLESALFPSARYVAFDYPATACNLYGTRPDVFGDAAYLPFADGVVDAVACYEVLEHVADPDRVLAEIRRVLSPGGVAELSMPFLYPVHDAPYDYQRWTRHGWDKRAMKAGLELERIHAANHQLAAAAVLACLALTGPLERVSGARKAILLTLALPLVVVINTVAWAGIRMWPKWNAMTTGHLVLLRKPQHTTRRQ